MDNRGELSAIRGVPGAEPWTEDGREDGRGDWSREPSYPSAAMRLLTRLLDGGLAEDWALLEPEVRPEEDWAFGRWISAGFLPGPAMMSEASG